MKRFRFEAQALLDWRRRRLEQTEEALRLLETRRRSSLDRAAECDQESRLALDRLSGAAALRGLDLRRTDAWRDGLAFRSIAALEAARRLEAEALELRAKLLLQKREVELLARLRERRLRERRKDDSRRLEELASELHLASRRRR